MSGKEDPVGIHFVSHPTEDEWEEYAFGRLPEAQAARVEEHLLACAACQSTLERVDTLIYTLRAARGVSPPTGTPFLASWIPFPIRPAILAVTLGVLLLLTGAGLVLSRRERGPLPIALVTLASFRGELMATAPTGHSLDLEISQTDVSLAAHYTVEVVTRAGDSIWKGAPEIAAGKLVSHIPNGLTKGLYWVRLFGPNATLIREFGLQVE